MSSRGTVDMAAVARAWTEQQVWSRTASRLKAVVDRGRLAGLLLAGATAVLATAATQVPGIPARILTATAAVTAGVAAIINRRVGSDRIREWTRARAASEGLKREVYSALAGGSDYAVEDPTAVLARRTAEIGDNVTDLRRHALGIEPVDRPLPSVTGADDYVVVRVDDQVERFYRPRATAYDRRVRRLRLLGDALGVLAVGFSAVAAAFLVAELSLWVPVVTTLGVSLTAHLAAARYDPLVVTYLAAAQRLSRLGNDYLDGWLTGPELVDECEDVISAENQSWVARWNRAGVVDEPGPQAAP
ncbi:MAG: DUF4231 domain-containing protein [Ornithinibacter sp.]